jgi:4-diphosphocytidyl-2-C-methyl-D-erythritol kinase
LPPELVEGAPAKINLTLRVIGRRADGYHTLESLVTFAALGDRLALTPGDAVVLTMSGAGAGLTGADADNLVLKAAGALAAQIAGLKAGAFHLEKNIPVAAGLGGGSADAAAALRLLARANDLAPDDPRLVEAARATGADVPVCLDPRPRVMRGIGDILSASVPLPRLHALLVNPGIGLPTKLVFSGWSATANQIQAKHPADVPKMPNKMPNEFDLLDWLAGETNDLEAPAIALAPVIAKVLAALRELAGCRLARMSGSGASCFALFLSAAETSAAAKTLRAEFPDWWVAETLLG